MAEWLEAVAAGVSTEDGLGAGRKSPYVSGKDLTARRIGVHDG